MKFTLFTSTTCQKCPKIKQFVKKSNLDVRFLDDTDKDFFVLAKENEIASVPVFLIEDGNKKTKLSEFYEVEDFIDNYNYK